MSPRRLSQYPIPPQPVHPLKSLAHIRGSYPHIDARGWPHAQHAYTLSSTPTNRSSVASSKSSGTSILRPLPSTTAQPLPHSLLHGLLANSTGTNRPSLFVPPRFCPCLFR